MRLLFCDHEYPPIGGGGGITNKLLADELAHRHEVTVLTSQALGLPRYEVVDGVQLVRIPSLFRRSVAAANLSSMAAYVVGGVARGSGWLQTGDFDVVNSHFALPTGPVGLRVAYQARAPHVLTCHGGDVYDPSKFLSPHRHALFRYLVRTVANRSYCVIANSNDTANNLRRYHRPSVPIEVTPHGIERPPADCVGRRSDFGLADDDFVMTTVGRLVNRKGVDRLLDVVAAIPYPNVKLVVIGTGPLEQTLRCKAEALNIAHRVRFLGFIPETDKFSLLGVSDLYVSTSQHEGFGIVFLEAMAMGLPVVCFDRGGQVDILEDGRTGFLVTLNDQESFRSRCETLRTNTALRRQMSAHALRTVEHYFIDTCARRHERIFEAAIEAAATALARASN